MPTFNEVIKPIVIRLGMNERPLDDHAYQAALSATSQITGRTTAAGNARTREFENHRTPY